MSTLLSNLIKRVDLKTLISLQNWKTCVIKRREPRLSLRTVV
jgi:hypothetical protein